MTIKRIFEVTKNYMTRHFFKNTNYIKPFLLDMSSMKLSKIDSSIDDENIESILFCDFHETKSIAYGEAKQFKDNQELLITDHNIPAKNFKFWYSIKNNKLVVNELCNFEDEDVVIPVRNLKSIIDKPFYELKVIKGVLKLFNGEQYIDLPYEQTHNNIGKCALISKEGHSMFVYGINYNHKEEINKINEFLKDHPSYPILVDNGRYMFYFIGEDTTKEAFLCGGFANIDDMFVVGSIK